MKAKMAQAQLSELLDQTSVTSGMTLRVQGEHFILGHPDTDAVASKPHNDDRVCLTWLSNTTFGLSVKRHTGRWERTPFSGALTSAG